MLSEVKQQKLVKVFWFSPEEVDPLRDKASGSLSVEGPFEIITDMDTEEPEVLNSSNSSSTYVQGNVYSTLGLPVPHYHFLLSLI